MEHSATIHIVDPSSRGRAALARLAYDLGRHAELYETCEELAQCAPTGGLALVQDDAMGERGGRLIAGLARKGCWLPVVMVSDAPCLVHAVAAMKAGALDYIALPFSAKTLRSKLAAIEHEAAEMAAGRRRAIEARRRIDTLSKREREVLDLLAVGQPNKLIARDLGISPRTVEIHRHNMMQKLDCAHSAAAVRMCVEAGLERSELLPEVVGEAPPRAAELVGLAASATAARAAADRLSLN